MTHDKYTGSAAGWTAREYADSSRYLQRRAELIAAGLPQGDAVLDLACGDGGLAPFVESLGLRYRGVDLNEAMVAEAPKKQAPVPPMPGGGGMGGMDF